MSKFDACLTSLNLRDSVPVDALRTTAAEYEADGMEPAAAMLRAVEEQLELAVMEKDKIIKIVSEQWEAAGGKKKPAQKAKAQAAEPAAEPKPGAVDNTPAPIPEPKAVKPAKPKDEPAPAAEPDETLRASVAYHGTPHEFDKFTLDHMGAGEGAQAYGYGLYFAGERKVAEYYREGLSAAAGKKGQLYKVDIPDDDQFLHLDKPLAEQSESVKAALRKVADSLPRGRGGSGPDIELHRAINIPAAWHTGRWAYNFLAKQLGKGSWRNDKAASELLNAHGIPGAMYADALSRGREDQTYNYVLYDAGAVSILEKEHQESPKVRANVGRTIEVDGVRRPITNSKGDLVALNFTEQQAFWRWFGDSKVIDEAGRPLVLYHGGEFNAARDKAFDPAKDTFNEGFFFTPYRERALRYANGNEDQVTAVYLSIKNPDGWIGDKTRLVKEGKDGVRDGSTGAWAAFNPEQIKSATDNAGTFDADNADITAATSTATSPMDATVADLVKGGVKVGAVLERIAADSANPDFRALAQALLAQNLKTTILFERAKGTYTAGVNASMATAAYKASTDTAYLHQVEGAESNALHELTHAATLKALAKGGLAAQQIKSLWRHVKALPNFAGEYGITNEEEFVAEAFTSPRFRQMLADTPAPGTKLSFWDKLVGIVKMLLGKPPVADSVLARVMAAGPELMAENNAAQDSTAQDDMPLAASTTPDLRASIAGALSGAANDIASVRLPASYLVGDLFNKTGKVSWWHKTIGTMDNLSRRQPAFRRVYDAVQSFIGDVSRYGTVAADQAPTLLPKLENVADILGAKRKKAVSAEDTKAFGRPVWEGTLLWARDANGKPVKVAELEAQAEALTTKQKAEILIQKDVIDDQQNQAWLGSPLGFYDSVISKKYAESQLRAGVVWTDAELRSMFNLTDHQLSLYKEFRSGVNKSLTNLAISEMVKMGGKYTKGMMAQAAAAPDVRAASELLRDHFRALAQENPEQVDMHLDTAKQIMDVADKAQGLMDAGYAPLSRYGKYTVYVEEGGEQVYFGMFETQAEASRMARKMKVDNPQASVIHGTMSEEAYKLFAGVSPETIELFGSVIGMDQTDPQGQEVYQAYLKLAKNNRSAMKRLIHRKGIAGFSEDAGRVLAGFIYSNARLTAANAHLGEVDEAVEAIPKQQGELKDAAVQLREHIRNPAPSTALGGLMFAQFLGGSVASAMVNLTQPFTMTFPFLSQYGGAVKAGQRMGEAIKLAAKKETGDAQLDAALKWATEEGIVAPQEIHYLQSQAAGKGSLMAGDGTKAGDTRAALNNTMAKVTLGWGKLFALAELSNRRITFIAAYKTALAEGIANPDQFAREAVSQTQGTYNQGNKPKWARNPVGGLLLTFKQFSIAYIELLSRMAFAGEPGSKERAAGQRAALLMIAVLFVMGGADGLPFEKDLEDLLDGILQRLGYNFSTARAKQAFLTDVLGEGGADFALKGISSLPGMPIDVSGRFGMGNLIPGTGLLTKKDSYARDLGEFAGPAGDLAKRAFVGTGKALGGDLAGAALEMSPVAARNLAKGVDMANTGSYNDARGYKVNDTTMTEAAMKAIGFQPNSTADIQDQKGQALNMISQNRIRSQEIAEHWAQGMAQNDPAMIQQARDMRNDWNEKNPETPIRVSMPGVLKRVRAMKQDAMNRTQKTAPRALKEAVKAELSDTRE